MATSGANKSSPYKYTSANHERFSQHSEVAHGQKENLGKDMNGNFGGPVEPDDFIDDLMPVDSNVETEFAERFKDKIQFTLPVRKTRNSNLESKLYEVFNTSIKKYGLSPNFKFHISADGKPKVGDIQYRPDGGFEELKRYEPPAITQPHGYNTRGKKQNLSIDDPEEDKEKTTDDDRREFDWCSDGLVVEFKRAGYMDPFLTKSQIKKAVATGKVTDSQGNTFTSFEKSKDEYVLTRGQLTMYATELFAHQHRTHLFQLLICGRRARFLYWDHSGAVVSHSFKYTKDPNTLARFLWRYNHMEDSDRGLDRTATVATDEESLRFHNAVEQLLKNMNDPQTPQRRLPHAADTLSGAYHVHKLTVFDDVTRNTTDVLVRKPFFSHRSAIGRGTRGYLAYHLTEEELKFLKDTWRVVHPRLAPERKLLRDLKDAGVQFVPEVLCGGDVPQSDGNRVMTKASDYTAEKVKSQMGFADPRVFCQHRLLEEIAYPLESVANSREFVLILVDIFRAIGLAHKERNVLHRDISIGNIMFRIRINARGILADWDHSALDETDSEHQNFRTGTWQFMSIGLCEDPQKVHDILDDYESSFWVLLYLAAHHFKLRPTSDGGRGASGLNIDLRLFDDCGDKQLPDGKTYKVGGEYKRDALRRLTPTGLNFASARLNKLISSVAKEWNELYSLQDKVTWAQKSAQDGQNTSAVHQAPLPNDTFDDDAAFDAFEDEPSKGYDQEELAQLTERLKTKQNKLNKAMFWIKLFKDAAAEPGWDTDDMLRTDRFPRMSKKEAAQQVYEGIQSSHMTGGDMVARDANQHAYTNELRQQPLQKVQVPPEQDEFDRDDASCICLEDEEGREDPDSDSDSDSDDKLPSLPTTTRARTSSTRFPPAPAPHSSMFSVSSWRSGTSSKRALSEDESSDSDSEDSVKDAQPLKKRKALVPGKPEFEAGSSAVASSVHRMSLGGATDGKKALQKGKGKERVEEHKEANKTAKTSKEARPTKALAKLRPRRTTGKADGEGSNGAAN